MDSIFEGKGVATFFHFYFFKGVFLVEQNIPPILFSTIEDLCVRIIITKKYLYFIIF